MLISQAFDEFEAALKAKTAAEIASIGAVGARDRAEACKAFDEALDNLTAATRRLLAIPVTGPTDLVLKARALRRRFPDGVEIVQPGRFGALHEPARDWPLPAAALHYVMRDMLALAE